MSQGGGPEGEREMERRGRTAARAGCSSEERPRRPKRRWCRVRVETDAGTYLGSLEVGADGLRELVGDERAYLGLWDAQREGEPAAEGFMALLKAAISSVVIVGEKAPVPSLAGAEE